MEDYIQEFELLVSQAPAVSEEQMMGYFLVELQSKIRQQIRPHDPKELARTMKIVLDSEETTYFDGCGGQSYYPSSFNM